MGRLSIASNDHSYVMSSWTASRPEEHPESEQVNASIFNHGFFYLPPAYDLRAAEAVTCRGLQARGLKPGPTLC